MAGMLGDRVGDSADCAWQSCCFHFSDDFDWQRPETRSRLVQSDLMCSRPWCLAAMPWSGAGLCEQARPVSNCRWSTAVMEREFLRAIGQLVLAAQEALAAGVDPLELGFVYVRIQDIASDLQALKQDAEESRKSL